MSASDNDLPSGAADAGGDPRADRADPSAPSRDSVPEGRSTCHEPLPPPPPSVAGVVEGTIYSALLLRNLADELSVDPQLLSQQGIRGKLCQRVDPAAAYTLAEEYRARARALETGAAHGSEPQNVRVNERDLDKAAQLIERALSSYQSGVGEVLNPLRDALASINVARKKLSTPSDESESSEDRRLFMQRAAERASNVVADERHHIPREEYQRARRLGERPRLRQYQRRAAEEMDLPPFWSRGSDGSLSNGETRIRRIGDDIAIGGEPIFPVSLSPEIARMSAQPPSPTPAGYERVVLQSNHCGMVTIELDQRDWHPQQHGNTKCGWHVSAFERGGAAGVSGGASASSSRSAALFDAGYFVGFSAGQSKAHRAHRERAERADEGDVARQFQSDYAVVGAVSSAARSMGNPYGLLRERPKWPEKPAEIDLPTLRWCGERMLWNAYEHATCALNLLKGDEDRTLRLIEAGCSQGLALMGSHFLAEAKP